MSFISCLFILGILGAPQESPELQVDPLHQKLLIVDSQLGTANLKFADSSWDIYERHPESTVDGPKLKEAGVNLIFLTIDPPKSLSDPQSLDYSLKIFDRVALWCESPRSSFSFAKSSIDPITQLSRGQNSVLLSLNDARCILPNRIELLRTFYRLGLRSLRLSSGQTNHLADASEGKSIYDGVSSFGRQVIEESNRIGVMLDISGLAKEAIEDALRYSKSPVLASSSLAFQVNPHPRNLSDGTLLEIARKGGVIQLSFSARLVSESYQKKLVGQKKQLQKEKERLEVELAGNSKAVEREMKKIKESLTPLSKPHLEEWFAHLDHIVRLVGVDAVGLGSGFDSGEDLVSGLKDITSLKLVTRELLRRGWTEDSLRKFYGGNMLRVWRQVEMVSETLGSK